MASKSALLLVAAALTGCAYKPGPNFEAGMSAVNVPVVSRADYVFDASAPGGSLSPSEAARLDGWFRSLDLRYGDSIYVEGSYSEGARSQIAGIASNYGMSRRRACKCRRAAHADTGSPNVTRAA